MFQVYLDNQTETYPLYEPLDDDLRIFEPILTQEMGQGGNFKCYIMGNHPNAEKIKLLKSEVVVLNNGKEIFRGRVLRPEYSMQNMISITCEGDLCYLLDSQQRPYEFTGTIQKFIEKMLEIHNEQVDEYKKIVPGVITITEDNIDVVRSESKYTTTIEALKSKLVDNNGGYLRVRNDGKKKYLDYLWDYGGINNQVIRFGENLLNIDRYLDATKIVTCLIPMGADIEYINELGEKQIKTIDITQVNDGKEYIQNEEAIEKFGKVWGNYKWNDVEDPEKLIEKARSYLKENIELPMSMEITALDLSLIDEEVQEFELGYWTWVSSEPHEIEKKLLLSKRVMNLLNPAAGSIHLGTVQTTFTDQVSKGQNETKKAVDQMEEITSSEIKRKIENATNLITGGLGGYVVLDNIDPITGVQIHPWRMLIMNTPDKETAKNVIQFNQNGFGFSTTGINGTYKNAWTIDGNLVADFITAGTMLMDRIYGGMLVVGGDNLEKSGEIIVKDEKNTVIGTWSKGGLSVKRGLLEGVDIRVGVFRADDDGVEIGGFESRVAWGRDILQSADGKTGFSAESREEGNLWIWAGWEHEDNFDFAVNNGGLCLARDFKCTGNQRFWKGWTLTETMEDVYNRISILDDRIDNI